MFDHKHVYVSLLKHKCLKEKHVSFLVFTVYPSINMRVALNYSVRKSKRE